MFGTLTVASPEIWANLVLGVDEEGSQPHVTLGRAYSEPLRDMGEVIRGIVASRTRLAG